MYKIIFLETINKDKIEEARFCFDGRIFGTIPLSDVLRHYHLEDDVRVIGDLDSFVEYVKGKGLGFNIEYISYCYQSE